MGNFNMEKPKYPIKGAVKWENGKRVVVKDPKNFTPEEKAAVSKYTKDLNAYKKAALKHYKGVAEKVPGLLKKMEEQRKKTKSQKEEINNLKTPAKQNKIARLEAKIMLDQEKLKKLKG